MKHPDYLKIGDKVVLVAPARSVLPAEMETAVRLLESWGLIVVAGDHVWDVHHSFAGRDMDRIDDFQTALDDPTVKAVFCARGGYGTLRIVDALCWEGFRSHPKWIVGFSDVTVLHGHIQRHCSMQSLHAPMPYSFFHGQPSPQTVDSLKAALFGGQLSYTWPQQPLTRAGKATGILTGGNLSLLYAMIGTPSEPDYEGCILFIEDLDEYLYHIDRMMLSLKRAGRLSRLAGMLVGGMTEMKDNKVPFGYSAEEIIAETVEDFDFPLAFGFPAGHGNSNLSLKMGAEVTLVAGEINSLYF